MKYMNKIQVLGIGSPVGLDCVGELVIEKLKSKLMQATFRDQVDLNYYDRPGFYLLELMRDKEIIHLINAIISDKPFGYSRCDQYVHELITQNQFQLD